jgi:hypothetical protein
MEENMCIERTHTFLTFSILYLSNYVIFRFDFFASHSEITNIMGGNSPEFFFAISNLKLLKIYFFIVDKIIEIFLPKIHKIFMKDSILTNFFAPSWFLTIFTNISNQFEIENAPKVSS